MVLSMSKKLTTQERAERLRTAIKDFRCAGVTCHDCIMYLYPEQLTFLPAYKNGQNDTEKTSCLCVYMAYKKTLFKV